MGSQHLGKDGQAVLLKERLCDHGLYCDDRGNTACEECSENSRTGGFLLGICSGWDQVAEWARKKSGEEYSVGRDERAQFFRDLAKHAEKTQEERRADYDKHEETYLHGPPDSPEQAKAKKKARG